MIYGSMDVVRETKPGDAIAYRILFYPQPSPERPAEHGAVRHQFLIEGDERLRHFFISDLLNQDISPERREKMAAEWIAQAQTGTLALPSVEISEGLFAKLTAH